MGLQRFLTLTYPEALLLGAALAWAYWRYVRNRNGWRTAAVVLAALLLAYPALRRTTDSFDLYLLVDRSRSISDEGRAKQREILDLARRNLRPGDRLAVVSFSERAYVEQAPTPDAAITSFQIPFPDSASELAEGLATTLAMHDDRRQAKILVLSDGEFTGRDPQREAQAARQRGVPIYFRDLKRADIFNLMVSGAETAPKFLANEPFRVAFNVRASVDTPGRYRLYRDGRILNEDEGGGWRTFKFRQGDNRIAFTDILAQPGIHSYKLEVETTPKDREPVRTDNVAEKFVGIVGEQPLLLINNTGAPDNVSQVLTAGGIPVHIVKIGDFRFGINQLAGYKGIVLNNVAALKMTVPQLEALRSFVLEEGGGLLVCGGNNSFAAGGYYQTALETVLPVSLEDRKQAKKISTAFSIVMDRSGSMSMPTPSGETKMSLANHAAAECVRLMTPADSVSVIPVDSAAHIVISQQSVMDPDVICSEILRVESMGGGIFTYTGLLAAGNELMKASQFNKHILLFADAADAEEPGEYKELLERYTQAGITVSVVGLGTEGDVDAEFLKDIARRGNGQVYFTEDAQQLVQFFTADTMTYSRKSFVEDPAPMKVLAAAFTISPDQQWKDFSAGGYNLLFSKEGAEIAIRTADEDAAPVLAFWHKGLGRAAALALDAGGEFSSYANFPDVVLSTARWIMGSEVFDDLQIKVQTEGAMARVTMEVGEEERARMGEATLEIYTPGGRTITKPLTWEGYDRLAATQRLTETGAYRGVVKVGGKAYKVGPIALPVSPEFAYDGGPGAGRRTLTQLASATGGREILDLRQLFDDRTRKSTAELPVPLPFLVGILVVFVADVAEQRFGWLAAFVRRARRRGQAARPAPAAAPASERRDAALADAVTAVASRSAARTRALRRGRAAEGEAPAGAQPGKETPETEGKPPAAGDGAAGTASESVDPLEYLSKSKARAGQAIRRRDPPR